MHGEPRDRECNECKPMPRLVWVGGECQGDRKDRLYVKGWGQGGQDQGTGGATGGVTGGGGGKWIEQWGLVGDIGTDRGHYV